LVIKSADQFISGSRSLSGNYSSRVLTEVYLFLDKENLKNNQRFEGKRVVDARKAQEGPREERNNRINQEGGPRREFDDEGRGRGGGRGRGMRGGERGGRGEGRGGRGGFGEGGGRGRYEGGAPGGRGGKREFERKSGDSRT
jgi:hypothetical protein